MTPTLLANTLLLTAATCGLSLPAGVALAWLLVRSDLPGRRLGLRVLALMLFVPLYLYAAAWQAGFGQQGWYTLASGMPPRLAGWSGAIWIHAMAAIPWVVLIVGAGLRLVEPELEEQALLDGSPWQVFRHVTLPGILPAIGLAAVWVAVITAGEMTVTDFFAIRTAAEEVYTQMQSGESLGPTVLGMLPAMVGIAAMLTAGMIVCARFSQTDRPLSLRRSRTFPLGCWRIPLVLLTAGTFAIMAAVPLGNLLYKAGIVVIQSEAGRVRTWSAAKCLGIVLSAPRECSREIAWSLLIGSLAATAAVVAAAPLAWLARRGGRKAVPALLVGPLCMAVPGPVLGLAVIALMNRPGAPWLLYLYDRSIAAPWLVLTIRAFPPALFILWHALRTIPPQVLEAAAVEGAGPIVQLLRIALPMRRPAIALAWTVALAAALGELAGSILVVPPGVQTLAIHIFGLLHYGVEDKVAGVCLALLAFMAANGAAAMRLARRWW